MYYYDYPFFTSQRVPVPQSQDMLYMQRNLQVALRLIVEAVSGEREDELFYDYLISQAPSEEDKDIIRSIRDDERKHNRMFKELYRELTGRNVPPAPGETFVKPRTYIEGIQKALFGELSAVEKYRQILFGMQRRKHINMVTEILTDELKHASKYNFLYTKNRTM